MRGVKLLKEHPDMHGMPVICKCLYKWVTHSQCWHKGDEECCGDIEDFGRCEVLVELFGFSLCLSLGLSCEVSGSWMEVHVGGGWVRVFLQFATACALQLQRQSTLILILISRSASRNTWLVTGMLWIL